MSNLQYFNHSFLDKCRNQGDPWADDLWQKNSPGSINKKLEEISGNLQLSSLLGDPQWKPLSNEPNWLDPTQILIGHRLFQKYSAEILGLLGLASLPYCYAHADGAKVLLLSNRIRGDIEMRLVETAKFVFDTCELGAFQNEKMGLVSALKVRMIHSAIRFHASGHDEYRNSTGYIPINQEEMAGTNLAFSLIAIRGMRKLGIDVTDKEANAYLHLWNYISFKLGLMEELLPGNIREANILGRLIFQRSARHSAAGQDLMLSLSAHLRKQVSHDYLGRMIDPLVSYLIGKQAAGYLGVNNSMDFAISTGSLVNLLRYAVKKGSPFPKVQKIYQQELIRRNMDPRLKIPQRLK